MMVPWDLVVIDEAHRLRNVYKNSNKIGKALKIALSKAPKILLTATPLQNSLLELYGLVSIVDEHTFGDAKSFKSQYLRTEETEIFKELKERLKPICHRTLRKHVLEYIKYTQRIPITQEFYPTDDEQKLYDKVSEYLRRPDLKALPLSQRKLMVLVMRKLLASSTFAIANTLGMLINKLESELGINKSPKISFDDELANEYESFTETVDEWEEEIKKTDSSKPLTAEDKKAIMNEIADLTVFRDIAISITENARGTALLNALQIGFAKAKDIGAAEKVIIFTESRKTQEYLFKLLSNSGYTNQIVLFNGANNDAKSSQIYAEWLHKNKGSDIISGAKSADLRAALVDYFQHSALIMIATEAAAEGINLQFCSMVVNYDLPWNPQRIEQRIGRCHRYGQKHDVVVINFLNKNNAADQRVFELLDEKFSLFKGVFGASDEILGAIESGVDIEKRIVEIYQKCRKTDEIEFEFNVLRTELEASIDKAMTDTRHKLLDNFDAEVHDRLRINLLESEEYLSKYENLLWDITRHELQAHAKFDQKNLSFNLIKAPYGIPADLLGNYKMCRNANETHRYRLGHPLAQHLIKRAAARQLTGAHLLIKYKGQKQKAANIENLVGKKGIIGCMKLKIEGLECEDHIFLCGSTDEGLFLSEEQIKRMFSYSAEIVHEEKMNWPVSLHEQVNVKFREITERLSTRQSTWFDEEIEKLDNWAEDKRKSLKSDLNELDSDIKALKKSRKSSTNMTAKISLERQIKNLELKRDQAWRTYNEEIRNIDQKKDLLIDDAEERLKQQITEEKLFCFRWHLT